MKIIKDINELTEPARAACLAFLAECRAQGLDPFITETYRTQARQDELYSHGRTAPGSIVTYTRYSEHTKRTAWDISFISTGYADVKKFDRAGAIALALGIEWGGTWKKPDRPHFQYRRDAFMLETAKAEAAELAAKAKEKGLISDEPLWYEYMAGLRELSPGNLRALFTKMLSKL